jgi:hypothetical protein
MSSSTIRSSVERPSTAPVISLRRSSAYFS